MQKIHLLMAFLGISFAIYAGFTSLHADAPPTATGRFHKGYDKGLKLGAASIQKYRFLKDGSCIKAKTITAMTWADKPLKTIAIPAGKRLRFEAETVRHETDRYGYCANLFAFTPKIGAVYDIIQTSQVMDRCYIEVIDATTAEPPEDLQVFDRKQCAAQL